MTLFKDRYRIESNRLKGWDYSRQGFYFVTICTRNRECFLGDVKDGDVHLSSAGEIVAEEWQKTQQIRDNVTLDQWVVMPNHLHGIIVIHDSVETSRRGVSDTQTIKGETGQRPVSTLGSIIGQFKSVCTKRVWAANHDFAWQTRFYDHVIRDENSLNEIREYILNNPIKWELDRNNPENLYM